MGCFTFFSFLFFARAACVTTTLEEKKEICTGRSGWCAMLEEMSKQSQEADEVPESDK